MSDVILEEKIKISVKGFLWEETAISTRSVLYLQQQFKLSEIAARLVAGRVANIDNAPDYISPTLKNMLPDPFHLIDMDKAVARVLKAIEAQEKIAIFGDYDVDGATSSALLAKYFEDIGHSNYVVYIPDRIKEGYGPSIGAFTKLIEQKVSLIITLDCGTSSHEAIDFANENGLEVIVIDHHLSSSNLPNTAALVNPNRFDETSSCKNLAAVGVAFLFAVALNSKLKGQGRSLPNLMDYLDLVALGTVCDVVSLEGLNRAFVKQGLKVIHNRKNIGINALIDIAGLNEAPSSYHLGYILGPRINAGGRVGESDLGIKLLSTNSHSLAYEIAANLDRYNEERKSIESLVLDQAVEMAKEAAEKNPVIVLAGNWHQGVIGIVAGRIKEVYNKPVAVISLEGGYGKASCRSIAGFDFGANIVNAKQLGLVTAGGGHAMAAGFSIEEAKISELSAFLNQKLHESGLDLTKAPTRNFDGYLSVAGINPHIVKQIEELGPYGSGHPDPKFYFKDVFITKQRVVGTSHIQMMVVDQNSANGKFVKAICFRAMENQFGEILLDPTSRKMDIIGSIKLNRWQGRETVDLIIDDIIL